MNSFHLKAEKPNQFSTLYFHCLKLIDAYPRFPHNILYSFLCKVPCFSIHNQRSLEKTNTRSQITKSSKFDICTIFQRQYSTASKRRPNQPPVSMFFDISDLFFTTYLQVLSHSYTHIGLINSITLGRLSLTLFPYITDSCLKRR